MENRRMKSLLVPAIILMVVWSFWPAPHRTIPEKPPIKTVERVDKKIEVSREKALKKPIKRKITHLEPMENERAPKSYQDIGLSEEIVRDLSSNETIDRYIQMAEEADFLKEDLVEESEQFIDVCPIESESLSCNMKKEVYQNSDGSQSRFTSVDGKAFLKQIRYPNGEKYIVFLGENGSNMQIQTLSVTIDSSKVAIDFDSQGRVSYYRNIHNGYFFEVKYKEGQRVNGQIGTKYGPDEKWVEVPFPIHL